MINLTGLVRVLGMAILTTAISATAQSKIENVKIITQGAVSIHSLNSALEIDSEIQFYDLSMIEKIEKQLSFKLSTNPNIAHRQALERIDRNFSQLKHKLHIAVAARSLIASHRIQRLPAAIINDSDVIYGNTDPRQIISLWKSQRR